MPKRWSVMVAVPLVVGAFGPGLAQDGSALLEESCGTCHAPTDGGLERIEDQRKTPEGWDMTIVRMMQLHGVELSADDRRALVKHLADSQGLAPSEAADWRYILEREPAVFEEPPSDDLATMCARCHSYARVALQRRTEEEWRKLGHFHLGQYPTTEYQALGRDRNWWEIASEELPPQLAELHPLASDAWTAWQEREAPDLSGGWRLVGMHPARGYIEAESEVTAADAPDQYTLTFEVRYADGETQQGEGRGILYNGYEWRGTATMGGEEVREVYALDEDGLTASGRWFVADRDSIGGRVVAARTDGPPRVLAVVPPYLKAGESAELRVIGVGLGEDVELGDGVTVDEVVSASPTTVVLQATAGEDAATGARDVAAGEADGEALLTVYDRLAEVTVEPPYNIARVGGGGGPIAPVPATFSAIGWAEGPEGLVRVGRMEATFEVDNLDEVAAAMDDASFAGTIEPSGLFRPAEAGLNPERPFETNNAGNLKVIATVEDGGETLTGEGQLLVTVQRWNDPPIR